MAFLCTSEESGIVEMKALILQKATASCVFQKVPYILWCNFIIVIYPFMPGYFQMELSDLWRTQDLFLYCINIYQVYSLFFLDLHRAFFGGWFRKKGGFSLIIFMTTESNLFSKALICLKVHLSIFC